MKSTDKKLILKLERNINKKGSEYLKDLKEKNILLLLSESSYLTADEIAQKMGITSRTVHNIMKAMNQQSEQYGAKMIAKKGKGYMLDILDKEVFEAFLKSFHHESLPTYPSERVNYIIWYLIQNDFVKLVDISEKIYVSQATLTHDMKEVENILLEHELSIERKPYYGMRVIGSEFHKRMCLADSIKEGCLYEGVPSLQNEKHKKFIHQFLKKNLEAFHMRLSAIAFKDLFHHLYIAIDRMKKNQIIEKESITNHMPPFHKQIQSIVDALIYDMETSFQMTFPESEKMYFILLLSAQQTMDMGQKGNLSFDSSILEIANDMIHAVYDAFKIDLRNDLELKMTLCQHLIPLQTRISCGISTMNPMLDHIRKEFPLCNAMALYASKEIQKRNHHILSEDEVGFIALAFALAMEKKKEKPEKRNICLVSGYGRMNAQLLEYQVKDHFGEYIENVYSIDVNEIDTFDLTHIDYIFSTVQIFQEVPVPIVQMTSLKNLEQVEFIKRIFTQSDQNTITQYFDQSLFLYEESRDKQEILRHMCECVEKKDGYVGLLESVLYRESMGNTVFCKDVAMSHPDKAICHTTHICISVLKEPVLWQQDKQVRVVFLICISKDKKDNLTMMYKYLSKIVTNKTYIDRLVKGHQYETLLDIIHEMNQIR